MKPNPLTMTRAELDAAYEGYLKRLEAAIFAPWHRLVAWCELHNVTNYAQFQPTPHADWKEVWDACTNLRYSVIGIEKYRPMEYTHHYEPLENMALPWPKTVPAPKSHPSVLQAYFYLREAGCTHDKRCEFAYSLKFRNIGPVTAQKLVELGIVEPKHANEPDGFNLLSARARNAIERIVSTEDAPRITRPKIKTAFIGGAFDKKTNGMRISIGRKTLNEIRLWLGLPAPEPNLNSESAALRKAWRLVPVQIRSRILGKIVKINKTAAQKLARIKPE